MWAWVIVAAFCAAEAVAAFVIYNNHKVKMQSYYDAAYKMIKEKCLDQAIGGWDGRQFGGQRLMVCLTWKDGKRRGYVFDPESGIRIGRMPGENELCVREGEVSAHHCILHILQGRLVVRDLNSVNGTFVKRGLFSRRVEGIEPLYTGDVLLVGNQKIKITLFTFDMACFR